MITNWLKRNQKNPSVYKFNVFDITESTPIDTSIKDFLSEQVLVQYKSFRFFKMHYEKETPEKLKDYLRNYVFPNEEFAETKRGKQIVKNVRQGDFGEILSTILVEEFTDLKVPISKLRFKFNSNRSVFCTDLIAHNNDEIITDLKYYEIKTRTSQNVYDVGIEAYESLVRDEEKPTETIANFLSNYYFEQAEVLFTNDADDQAKKFYDISTQFAEIVKNPQNYNRSFEIILIIEKSYFKEIIIKKLDALSLKLSPLEITIVLIDNLGDLVTNSYKNAEDIAVKKVFPTPALPVTSIEST